MNILKDLQKPIETMVWALPYVGLLAAQLAAALVKRWNLEFVMIKCIWLSEQAENIYWDGI